MDEQTKFKMEIKRLRDKGYILRDCFKKRHNAEELDEFHRIHLGLLSEIVYNPRMKIWCVYARKK